MAHTASPSDVFAFKKLRLYLAWPLAFIAIAFSVPTTASIRYGLPLVLVGVALRWWAAGCVQKGRVLMTGGPYAYTRNPLYLGSWLMLLGVCVMLRHIIFWILLPAIFLWVYWGTIRKEEADLERKFGERYVAYAKAVPRWLPRWRPYPSATRVTFQWRQAVANGETITTWATALIVLLLYFYRIFALDGCPITQGKAFWMLVAIAVAAELALDVVQRRYKDQPARESVGTWLFHRRAWLPVPLVVGGAFVLLAIGNPLPFGAPVRSVVDVVGLACLATAEGLRMWGVGHCGRRTRSAFMNAELLVTSGPYAHVRHPLYLSNLLITLGVACLTGCWLFLLACGLYWLVIYRRIIEAEEAFLRAKFGRTFDRYAHVVPRLIPLLRAARLPSSSTFRKGELRKEYQTVIAIVATVCCIEALLVAHAWIPKASRVWLHRFWRRAQAEAQLDRPSASAYSTTSGASRGERDHA